MTSRRSFLRTLGLASGAVLVGDEVLSAFERLTHRKVFALGGLPDPYQSLTAVYRKTNTDITEAMRAFTEEYSWVEEHASPRSLFALDFVRSDSAVLAPTTGPARFTFVG